VFLSTGVFRSAKVHPLQSFEHSCVGTTYAPPHLLSLRHEPSPFISSSLTICSRFPVDLSRMYFGCGAISTARGLTSWTRIFPNVDSRQFTLALRIRCAVSHQILETEELDILGTHALPDIDCFSLCWRLSRRERLAGGSIGLKWLESIRDGWEDKADQPGSRPLVVE